MGLQILFSKTPLSQRSAKKKKTHSPNLAHHLFFVNKVLLKPSHAYLLTYCPWLLSCYNSTVEITYYLALNRKSLPTRLLEPRYGPRHHSSRVEECGTSLVVQRLTTCLLLTVGDTSSIPGLGTENNMPQNS